MVMLVIFCTNAINILAGVNGLEAGQTFIIACAVAFHNIWELAGPAGAPGGAHRDGHLFSLYLMLPLAATTFALLHFNWFPSQVTIICNIYYDQFVFLPCDLNLQSFMLSGVLLEKLQEKFEP